MKSRAALSLAPKAKPGPSYSLIRRAVRLFRSEYAPRSVRRHNAKQWLASVESLGPKWLLAVPQTKGEA